MRLQGTDASACVGVHQAGSGRRKMTHADEGGKQAEAGENRPGSTGAECNQQAPEEGGRKTKIGRSRSGAPSRGTQLKLSLWAAGLEARPWKRTV